jgi:hypothetical protein
MAFALMILYSGIRIVKLKPSRGLFSRPSSFGYEIHHVNIGLWKKTKKRSSERCIVTLDTRDEEVKTGRNRIIL